MSQDSYHEEEKPFLDEDQLDTTRHITTRTRRDRIIIIALSIATVLSWLLTTYLLLSRPKSNIPPSTPGQNPNATLYRTSHINNGSFPTDLLAMRSAIHYEQRTFTGALDWDADQKIFFRNSSSGPQYVGPPSKEMDDAWEDLLRAEFTPFLPDEAASYTPRLKTFNGHYRFEPDVMHSLHCVNEIRKRVDGDYYYKPDRFTLEQKDWDRIHIDHCIDQVRQSIMCFGDLSPVPLYSWPGAPLGIGQGTTHTCRRWEDIREWVDQRHKDMRDV